MPRKTQQPQSSTMPSPTSVVVVSDPRNAHMSPLNLLRKKSQQHYQHQHQYPAKVWKCQASCKSKRALNPIRAIVDALVDDVKMGYQREDRKDPISLALGDPTVSSKLKPCKAAVDAVMRAVGSANHAASYVNASGTPEARIAVANYHSYHEHIIGPENVVITNGCSGALELALNTLLDPGSTVLVPQPGFPLYQMIAEAHGASVCHYPLLSDQNWECDFDHMESIMASTKDVRAIIINNPSNPTGAVFSECHLKRIINFAFKHRLPILSDEVYGDITFAPNKFHPIAQVAARMGRQVPIITASGLAKQFLVPGWRAGWLAFHDNIYGSLNDIQLGVQRLAQIQLGASHLAQAAIPVLLSPSTPGVAEWKHELKETLERQCMFLCNMLSHCEGLEVIPAQGAMYVIVKIDCQRLCVADDIDFARQLLEEENVFVLPGTAFGVRNVFRVVFSSPGIVLEAAALRINSFCQRNAV
mmetsp:Transcript_22966/g.65074  ORF Transcript_22966/g.65074 Transcript_22966/m.65074 type:complete len:473 (-) Transcript_22966:208-1626(-)